MDKPLRVLIVEDSEDDALLIARELRKGGFDIAFERVDSPKTMEQALRSRTWDIVLADYAMPLFNGLDALRILQESGQDLPFLIVSGSIGEETAVAAMKAGAHDYVMKDSLPRLVPAVARELQEAEVRRVHREADRRLKESETRLRHLSSQLLAAQEQERKRIAGEIHDSLGACLSAVKFKVEDILKQIEDRGGVIAESWKEIIPMIQEAVEEVRRIQADLRPSILDDLGIIATFSWFCRRFQAVYSGIRVEQEIFIEEDQVPDHLKIVIFRVMQEAMNNVAKHSRANVVHLSLRASDDGIELTVRDNGRGFTSGVRGSAQDSRGGLGLISMRERAELSGASFSVDSAMGAGTNIRVFWPHREK